MSRRNLHKLPFSAFVLAAAFATGASAQEADQSEDGFDFFSEGAREFLENLQSQLEPLMDELSTQIEGLNQYHAPEILPNGDIIIRRKTPEADPTPPAPEDDTIEL